MKMTKKTIITFSVLGAVLLCLIAGLIVVLVTGNDEGDDPNKITVDVWEGEGVYGTKVLLAYPMIEEASITKIEIFSENGDYEFVQGWDETKGAYKWQLKGTEDVEINLSMFEMLRMWLSIATTKDPVRNATDEQLKDYGVDESCKNGYTVYFTDENKKEQSYRVRIGNKVLSDSDIYYAYIEGRNHVYKLDNDIFTYTAYPKTKYLKPIINTFFSSNTNAYMGVDKFAIYQTNGNNTTLSNILSASVSEKTESSVEFKIVYAPDEYGRKRTTIASTSYLTEIFSLLYTSFTGEEVVSVDPSEDELKSFGLASDDQKYFIDATFAADASFASGSFKSKDPSFYVSKSINGYNYVLSKYYNKDIVVRLADTTFSFLKTDNTSLLKWTDTTSIKSGFNESITENSDTGAPGLNKIVLKTPNNEEVFILTTENGVNSDGEKITILTVKGEKSGLVFKDNINTSLAEDKNQFRTLFVNLLYYPFIEDFNKKTNEEIEKIIKEGNIAYSITAYRNDGVVVKYDYYELDVNLAMEVAHTGKLNTDGTVTYDAPEYNYIVTMKHIRQVCEVIDKLMAGEHISDPI